MHCLWVLYPQMRDWVSIKLKHKSDSTTTVIESVERSEAEIYQRCFLAKARPDPVFKYFSNSKARSSFSKFIEQTNCQGLNFDVCGELPSLCF